MFCYFVLCYFVIFLFVLFVSVILLFCCVVCFLHLVCCFVLLFPSGYFGLCSFVFLSFCCGSRLCRLYFEVPGIQLHYAVIPSFTGIRP